MNAAMAREAGCDRIVIFGAGGHGRELAWLVAECWGEGFPVDFVVDRREYLRDDVDGRPVVLLRDYVARGVVKFVVALGDPKHRRNGTDACLARGLVPATLVHPRVEMSRRVDIGAGAVVCAGSILTTNVRIGAHAHVNIGCTVSHDSTVGEFATLSPGVRVAGNVRIGPDVFVGIGATFINGAPGAPLDIGEGAIVAAGACVIAPVPAHAMVAGVPAIVKHASRQA